MISKRGPWTGAFGLATLAVIAYLVFRPSSGHDVSAADPAAAVPVSVAAVIARSVPFQLHAIGTVVPYTTVAVKARVDGQIVAVHFVDGEHVARGATLFEIDARPYRAQLDQAEANLARDRASLKQAEDLEGRYERLRAQNFVSRDLLEQARTGKKTAEATVRASEAAVESARLQLDFCTIRSPIDGYTGRIMSQIGNLVEANADDPLVTVNRIMPVYALFSVPEQKLAAIRAQQSAGELAVQVTLPDSGRAPVDGHLSFIDNSADASTGTIALKAEFPNRDTALWPGQFVDVVLTLYRQDNAIVVPTAAVQNGPDGQYVFLVKPDRTVEIRAVTVARTEGEQSIIASGLQPGDEVVTVGQLRLAPGSRIAAVPADSS